MNLSLLSAVTAPEWLLLLLASGFFAGFVFYLVRLLSPEMVRKTYGYFDWENEVGHGICMLSMASMIAPGLLPIPALAWAVGLGAASLWFLARALTWGRKLPYNKAWWDWAHVGMLSGMAVMFVPLPAGSLVASVVFVVSLAFWGWFSYHYTRELIHDCSEPKALYLGSDLSHLSMGVVMFVMTLFPALLMPHHGGSHQHGGGTVNVAPAPVPASGSDQFVTRVDDATVQSQILQAKGPVIVLVFGGCDKCATELPIFREVAKQYAGKACFVIVHKDDAPAACKALGVTECPVILVVKNGQRQALKLEGPADEASLRSLVDQAIAK